MKNNNKLIIVLVILFEALILTFSASACYAYTSGTTDFELSELHGADFVIVLTIYILVLAEIVAIAAAGTVFLKRHANEEMRNKKKPAAAPVNRTVYDKKRTVVAVIGALIITAAVACGGYFASLKGLRDKMNVSPDLITILAVSAVAFIIGLLVLIYYIYKNRTEAEDVASFNERMSAARSDEKDSTGKITSKLKRLRFASDIFTAFLIVSGAAVAFVNILRLSTDVSFFIVLYISFMLILAGLSRTIPFKRDTYSLEKYCLFSLERSEYPALFGIAERAAADCGYNGKIKILIVGNGNIGVTDDDDSTVLLIGISILTSLGENELYSVLLHEFSHVKDKTEFDKYAERISVAREQMGLLSFAEYAFYPLDQIYLHNFGLLGIMSSLKKERCADKLSADLGYGRYLSSALIKLFFFERFEFESVYRDSEPLYSGEKPREDYYSDIIEKYKDQLPLRRDAWLKMIGDEVRLRASTHPTIRERIEQIGISDYVTVDDDSSEEYGAEIARALSKADQKSFDLLSEHYEDDRKVCYIDPLEIAENWREEGMPISAEGYYRIVDALEQLGMFSDAENVCDRAIEELDAPAAAFAMYSKASYMLHRYDEKGIDLMWRAVENNDNAIKQGLNELAAFYSLTGRKEELEKLYGKSDVLYQHIKDVVSERLEVRSSDKLSLDDTVPEDELEALKAYIKETDSGNIDCVYLVKKQITEDESVSAVVVKFKLPIEDSETNEALEKIFTYLDTVSNHQYALFDYDTVSNIKFDKISGCVIYKGEKTEV